MQRPARELGEIPPYPDRPTEEILLASNEVIGNRPFHHPGNPALEAFPSSDESTHTASNLSSGVMKHTGLSEELSCVEMLWRHTWLAATDSAGSTQAAASRRVLDHCALLLQQKILGDPGI